MHEQEKSAICICVYICISIFFFIFILYFANIIMAAQRCVVNVRAKEVGDLKRLGHALSAPTISVEPVAVETESLSRPSQ